MTPDYPAVPAAYELVVLDQVDDVVEEAVRRASRGAGEGTLIWAREQTAARTASGKRWYAPAGNLHCALIIEPEYDNVSAQQLLYVATISVGTAIAETVEAMTGLRWRWPGRILINGLKSGMVRLSAPGENDEPYPWLVLGVSVNVAEHPPNPEPERFNSIHASGTPDATVEALLEGFSRHFLSWINRWAEEGFEPVRKAWTLRADGIGETLTLDLDGGKLPGRFKGINELGEAELQLDDGSRQKLSVSECFRLGRTARAGG